MSKPTANMEVITVTMTLDLAPEMEAYLREKAAREGQAAETVAQAMLAQAIRSEIQGRQEVSLQDYGISLAQAAELRASFTTFAGEWERPEMDVYNDYEAAKARLEANPAYAEIQTSAEVQA